MHFVTQFARSLTYFMKLPRFGNPVSIFSPFSKISVKFRKERIDQRMSIISTTQSYIHLYIFSPIAAEILGVERRSPTNYSHLTVIDKTNTNTQQSASKFIYAPDNHDLDCISSLCHQRQLPLQNSPTAVSGTKKTLKPTDEILERAPSSC